mmetsp:Transcript_13720/g.14261  ORF Transcript_13720/g.14261 Transcript_13720/m.14261 type:complete len:715 (+) Transcript_13720:67-2211(+)
MIITSFLLFSSSFLSILADNSRPKYIDDGMCTALGIGRLATSDQSTITTHNADCQECDIRVTHVPARDWPSNSKRPVFRERLAYPRLLETEENNIHGPEYLVGTIDTTIYPWEPQEPIFYVDQVEHTYAYTMGHYPLQNEKQLTMGESTCYTTFWSIPSYFPDGKANFNLRSLMEIAMERCETARCAITTMGDYAVKYGFYAIDGSGPKADSGESLSIGDKKEMWIFHINADDTHESAVWVAQRVPDDEIAVIANQYIIGEIDLSNPDYFMASSNVYDVATRAGLWSPDSGEEFSYLKVYGTDSGASSDGCTRRVWRVFTLANPSLQLSPYTDSYGSYGYGPNGSEPYPFSVKPEKPLNLQDVFRIVRDNYDGTEFDLMNGPDAGPFGDVIRSGPNSIRVDPINGLTADDYKTTVFPNRAISIWRTAYSSIAQARASLSDVIGPVTWIAANAPHHATFVPVYANVETVPETLTNTTQYKFDKSKNYWTHSVVGNYLSRWFKWTLKDVQDFQKSLEEQIFTKQHKFETSAAKQLAKNNIQEALNELNRFQQETGEYAVQEWWNFFWGTIVSKYRDIYKITRPNAENFLNAPDFMGYDRWWSEMVGYWGLPGQAAPGRQPLGVPPLVFETTKNQEEFEKKYPLAGETRYFLHPSFAASDVVIPAPDPNATTESTFNLSSGATGFLFGFFASLLIVFIWSKFNTKSGYERIPDSNVH